MTIRRINALLKQHDIIGWDIDRTLIAGPNSELFREYVKRHPEKQHHLITFRSSQHDLDNMKYDLCFSDFSIDLFSGIHCVPADVGRSMYSYDPVHLSLACHPDISDETFFRNTSMRNNRQEMVRNLIAFNNFKPLKCREIGSGVLIDDMVRTLKDPCERHGVTLIDSCGDFSDHGVLTG